MLPRRTARKPKTGRASSMPCQELCSRKTAATILSRFAHLLWRAQQPGLPSLVLVSAATARGPADLVPYFFVLIQGWSLLRAHYVKKACSRCQQQDDFSGSGDITMSAQRMNSGEGMTDIFGSMYCINDDSDEGETSGDEPGSLRAATILTLRY